MPDGALRVFSTCPPAGGDGGAAYLERVTAAARWSERAGCVGILVYSDNGQVDPWLVAQAIAERTSRLSPLVAVQPVYMHPYAAAKLIASIGYLHGRRLFLNLTAGGFANDLLALDDETPHDRRYARLVEYARVVMGLLGGQRLDHAVEFYRVRRPVLKPALAPELLPGLFVAGSSPAGLAAARALGATAVRYPQPAGAERAATDADGVEHAIRVGVVAREHDDEAWAVARRRFPESRAGQLTHQLAMKVTDSCWHRQLSDLEAESPASPYWLVPFQNYASMCPYLVGSYDRVAEELRRYAALGYGTVILDVPPSEEELDHTSVALGRAAEVPAQ
jgi:alkanesulfonate monooxygenase